MINYYQKEARKTAIYSQPFTYPVLGLVGEFGEATDTILPSPVFSGQKVLVDAHEATKELGDILWYITNTTLDVGLTLEDLACDITGGLQPSSFTDLSFQLTETSEARRIFLLFMINAGRLAEVAKKALRDNGGALQAEKLPIVREALAGCLRAWLQICEKYGISPDDAAIINIEKLTRRKDEGKIQGDGDYR